MMPDRTHGALVAFSCWKIVF